MISAKGFIPVGLIYAGLLLNMIVELAIFFLRKSISERIKKYAFYTLTSLVGAGLGATMSELNGREFAEVKSLIASSAIITMSLFVSITIFSFLTVKRVLILFGSLIVSLVLSLISIFMFSCTLKIIFGLIIGCLYVVVDTQIMIHNAENGRFDPYHDARQLFYDLIKIFTEILKLLSENEKKKEKKK